jgi:manganese transport protein
MKFEIPLGSSWMIAVGYFDPGNWSTDLEAGSKFGYDLLWVMVLANIMAVFLQHLCIRLAFDRGEDLAQISCLTKKSGFLKDSFCRNLLNIILYLTIEAAMIATDLAQIIGSAMAIRMLFGISLFWGSIISALDVVVVFFIFRDRKKPSGEPEGLCNTLLEGFVAILMLFVSGCIIIEVFLLRGHIKLLNLFKGVVIPKIKSINQLPTIMGLIGATVMPHNLYLHSALARREIAAETSVDQSRKKCLIKRTRDIGIALLCALFVNGGIMVMSTAVTQMSNVKLETLEAVSDYLKVSLGKYSSIIFALGLLASGISATIAGTLSGQAVIEGFFEESQLMRVGMKWRNIFLRGVTLCLALLLAALSSEKADRVLFYSQVALSIQLPIAVIPLIYANHKTMNLFSKFFSWSIVAIIVLVNVTSVILSGMQVSD